MVLLDRCKFNSHVDHAGNVALDVGSDWQITDEAANIRAATDAARRGDGWEGPTKAKYCCMFFLCVFCNFYESVRHFT